MRKQNLILVAIALIFIFGFGTGAFGGQPNAGARPASDPTYCTGTPSAPGKARQNGKDATSATLDVRCDAPQFVEWIYTITRQGTVVGTGDIAAQVGAAGCGSTNNPCGKLFQSAVHKLGQSFNGQDTFTITATLKIWTASTGFCTAPTCYPFGTPLRVIDLVPVSVTM